MEIRFATKGMIPQIKKIWHRCFGDEEEYMEFYFTHRFTEENMLVCIADEKPVAMTTFLKAYLVMEEGEMPVHYAYAVATLPDYLLRLPNNNDSFTNCLRTSQRKPHTLL